MTSCTVIWNYDFGTGPQLQKSEESSFIELLFFLQILPKIKVKQFYSLIAKAAVNIVN